MKIHINKIPAVIQEFAQARLISKAPTPLTQFGIGFALPYVATSVNKMLSEQGNLAHALGVVAPDGTIDIDMARSAGISAIASAGGKVTMYGIAFDRSDIDALFDIAKHQIGE